MGGALCPSSPFPLAGLFRTPLCPSWAPPARLPCPGPPRPPPPPLGAPSPLSPPSRAPRLPRGGRVEGWGGACAPLPFAFGAGRPPVAVPPPARCPRRVSGPGGAAAGPRGASPGLGSAPPRGGLGASAHAGLPPSSAASRRPPWTVVSRSVGCPLGTPPYHSASLLPDPASGLGFRVGLLSFPASAPPPSRALARSCPASRRSPPPPVARRGLGCGCGEGRGG